MSHVDDPISIFRKGGAVYGKRFFAIEPKYFKEHVSTELKDRAKQAGLIYFDKDNWKIIITDSPKEKRKEYLEIFGLEQYLEVRLGGGLQ